MSNDSRLREMTSDPRGANVLVTDGGSAHSQELVRALGAAGAARVWVGLTRANEPVGMPEGLREVPQVTSLRLDITDEDCVREAASAVGSEIDILINTAEVPRAGRGSQTDSEVARSEMETHYFGLLNLGRYFAPSMIARAAHTQRLCPAWVNVLSIFALSSDPPRRTFSASMAAAHALSQCMRAQLREAGIRLVTVFPGSLENERDQELQQPKLTSAVLAKSIVDALRRGMEEVYPGDVAREWFDGMLDRRTAPNRVDPLSR